MRATIQIHTASEQTALSYWAVIASDMLAEHAKYYARERQAGVNRGRVQVYVDAVNSHSSHAAAYAATSPAWGDVDHVAETAGAGATVDPEAELATWETSTGNLLQVRRDGAWLFVTVEGRRHGIPWQFLARLWPEWKDDAAVIGQDSRIPALPWIATGEQGGDMAPAGMPTDFDALAVEREAGIEDYQLTDFGTLQSDSYARAQRRTAERAATLAIVAAAAARGLAFRVAVRDQVGIFFTLPRFEIVTE